MKKTGIILLISLLAIIGGCKQEEVAQEPTILDVTTSTKDETLIQSIFDDANTESDMQHASTQEPTLRSENAESPVITVDAGANGFADSIWTITVDFGEGIIGRYGWERKGKIIIDVHGFYKEEGSTRTLTFKIYYVNGNKVEGTHVEENMGFNETDQAYIFNITVTNAELTKSDGSEITWASQRTRKWLAGYETPLDALDDEYEITGETHGVNSDGKSFIKEIVEPLFIQMSCQYIQDGKVQLSIEGVEISDIDFGYEAETADECDNEAEFTYKTRKIILTM